MSEASKASSCEPHRERCNNLLPRRALIGAMHETSNAAWWDTRVKRQLTHISPCEALYTAHAESFQTYKP